MGIEECLQILKNNDYKYTGKREHLVQLFFDEKRYLTAKQVLHRMQQVYPGVSFDTVYRNLSIFEQLNIIESTEWDGERRYRFHCKDDHHHHIICTKCGRTKVIEECPLYTIEKQGFDVIDHKFEVYGLCERCKERTIG